MSSRLPPPPAVATDDWVRRASDRAIALLRSVRPGSVRDAVDTLAFTTVVTAVVVVGYLQGAVTIVLPTPAILGTRTLVVPQAVFACLTVSGLFGLSAIALFGQFPTLGRDDRLPTAGPSVAAVVPVHRDAPVLHRSVESLLESEYADLRVYVVAEPGDEACIQRGRELATRDRVTLLVNTRYPGSKAGAVNYAAEVTDSAHLAVFDADERVHPRFVPAAVAKLADAEVVQGRTVPEPDGLVESLAYYESVVLGDLSQRLLTVVTDFTVVASRAVVMRRSAFERVGGYDAAMLTEDYDFAFRCYEADVDVREEFARASTIEAAHTPADWWGQRKRWMTGYAQVLHRLVGNCRSPTSYRTLLSPAICAGSVLGNLFMLSLVSKALVLVHNGAAGWLLLPIATLAGVTLALRTRDARVGAVDGLDAGWLLTPLILPLYSLVGIKATIEYMFTWDGEWYSVAKGH